MFNVASLRYNFIINILNQFLYFVFISILVKVFVIMLHVFVIFISFIHCIFYYFSFQF